MLRTGFLELELWEVETCKAYHLYFYLHISTVIERYARKVSPRTVLDESYDYSHH